METGLGHTIIPDGYFDLIAEFENHTLKLVKLTGVWAKPIHVHIPKSTKIFGIRFKLLAAEYLLQHKIKSILNTTENLPLNFWNIDTYESSDFERFVIDISSRLENSIKHLKEIDTERGLFVPSTGSY
ncbi:DUF6597 domain-containing transcriptional factor [Algoriphagus sp. 4150]|uniref:DUF6597 domain-containing transcriptional factor n=1 Tax=Algoriphagus sp. 4150 TaxID=2817756 RepID=UPI00286D005C|nr:DUF6597 domain-containing transcriptional factor [Algoriphagus sp. 4150]